MTPIDFNDLPKDGESLIHLARQCIESARTREECDMALALIKKGAELGYPEAQFELARFCAKGFWLGLDVHQVVEWCTKAANNGFIPAQRDLGIKAYEGYAGEPDFEEAIKWFSMADDLGDMESKCWLGIMHIEGKGFPKNHSLGHSLISWAAKKDCKKAHLELSYMYEFGTDVIIIDTDKAEESFFHAMDLFGPRPDKGTTKKVVEPKDEQSYPKGDKRFSVQWSEVELSPRFKYERTVQNFWLPAAERGYPEAQFQLARQYDSPSLWEPSSPVLSKPWYERASKQGHVQAQIHLAALLKCIELDRE